MSTTDERENLINQVCQYLLPLVPDVSDAKAALYIIASKYEIMSRSTELVEVNEDRNDNLIKMFLMAKAVKGCTKRTLRAYALTARHALQEIGKTATEITADDIRLYMALRKKRDMVSNVTIGNEMRNLNSFFQWMAAEEYIAKSPMSKVEKIKMRKKKKEAFTDMEVEKLRWRWNDHCGGKSVKRKRGKSAAMHESSSSGSGLEGRLYDISTAFYPGDKGNCGSGGHAD